MKINFGKIISISTVDWHGRSASTIFFSGCPFKCPWCQNYKLLDCRQWVGVEVIEKKILDAKTFISAVVFSGGEPTMQSDGLICLAEFVKKQGLLVGVQTNGYYPDVLRELVERNLVDKIFLDIKASPYNKELYEQITGRPDLELDRIMRSLNIGVRMVDGHGCECEVRTTIFRSSNDSLNVAKFLVDNNYFNKCEYVIQQGIPHNTLGIEKKDMLTKKEIIDISNDIEKKIGCQIKIRIKV